MSKPLIPPLLLCAALGSAQALASSSTCPSADHDVAAQALEIELAYIAQDLRGFDRALDELKAAISCLAEPLSPATAAAIHRSFALGAVLEMDQAAAEAALQAAYLAAPDWQPSPSLAPPGSELAVSIELTQVSPLPTTTTLTPSAGLASRLDGSPSWRRPDQLPVVLQLIDRQGDPLWSGYLQPGDPLPSGIVGGPVTAVPMDPKPQREPRVQARVRAPTAPSSPVLRAVLIGGTGALAVTAVGLGVASSRLDASWEEAVAVCDARPEGCSWYTEQINEAEHQRARKLGLGAGVAAAGSVALGVTVALTW